MTKKEADQLSNVIYHITSYEKVECRLLYLDPYDESELEFINFKYDINSNTYSFELKEGIEDSLWIEEEEVDINRITLLKEIDWQEYAKNKSNSSVSG